MSTEIHEVHELVDRSRRTSLQDVTPPLQNVSSTPHSELSSFHKVFIVAQLSGIIFLFSAGNGLTIVGLPIMTSQLKIPSALAFWPTSVTSLASASTILLSGSMADVLGPTLVDRAGCVLMAIFVLAAGGVENGTQLVTVRAISGIGAAMHSAASVGIISSVLPRGRSRNIAYSCFGLSAPLGFSFGLVVGGIMIDTTGWRAGWYLFGSIMLVFCAVGFWALPRPVQRDPWRVTFKRLQQHVDWVGALLASAFMSMLSYLLATLSTDVTQIKRPESIALLCLAVVSLPLFLTWVHHQVQRGRPALIPNSFWKNLTFTTICGTIVLSFAVLNSLELFASLFFQEIQHLSPLQTSLRILPSMIVGAMLNLTIGFMVDRIPPIWIVTLSSVLCAIAPLLMAVIHPQRTYWGNAFIAQLLQPVSCDALFTVGLVVISEIFPEDKQALGGAVFNMVAQFGNALGLSIMQIVSMLVKAEREREGDPAALMSSYRASFWTMFGMMLACALWGGLGLRRTGKIGLHRD
ncbi:putative MFS transporter [Kockovaella imperatae]|uniref:Putative MFS transporter n=1 Tax=Kockovaella imperatae TaxID=4999 RepID=A0A1Y1UBZ6_9TREE|nr:putative MFS transporter [Kockovaella imperatae]ORX35560.1 putative MFS transporter [Kockovaella imperatae]